MEYIIHFCPGKATQTKTKTEKERKKDTGALGSSLGKGRPTRPGFPPENDLAQGGPRPFQHSPGPQRCDAMRCDRLRSQSEEERPYLIRQKESAFDNEPRARPARKCACPFPSGPRHSAAWVPSRVPFLSRDSRSRGTGWGFLGGGLRRVRGIGGCEGGEGWGQVCGARRVLVLSSLWYIGSALVASRPFGELSHQ